MTDVPEWVTTSVGIYTVLGSVFFVVLIVVAGYMLVVLRQILVQVGSLTNKVESLTDKVQTIAEQVNSVTTEVGARTTGIVRMVDESAGRAIRVLEVLAPVLVVFGAFLKVRRYAARKR